MCGSNFDVLFSGINGCSFVNYCEAKLISHEVILNWLIIFYISCIGHLGESVPESERTSEKELTDTLSASSSTHNLPSISKAMVPGVPVVAMSDEERILWEEEKQKLYQQLDDKVCVSLGLTHSQTERLWFYVFCPTIFKILLCNFLFSLLCVMLITITILVFPQDNLWSCTCLKFLFYGITNPHIIVNKIP